MRTFAILCILCIASLSVQQTAPVQNECLAKGLEVLPFIQNFDLTLFKTNAAYASSLIAKIIVSANACLESLSPKTQTKTLGAMDKARCKMNIELILNQFDIIKTKFLGGDFGSIKTNVNIIKDKIMAARFSCL